MASSSQTTNLLSLVGSTSKVWEYFGFPAKDGSMNNFIDNQQLCTVNYMHIVSLIWLGKFFEPNKKERNTVYCKLFPKVLKLFWQQPIC